MIEAASPSEKRLESVHTLRGIAALSVAIYHLVLSGPPDAIAVVLTYGSLGVPIFFVISGFVLPLALFRSHYKVPDIHRFMLRRIIRIEPAYLVMVGAVILLSYAALLNPLHQYRSYLPDLTGLALHVGYLAPFFGHAWLSPVFWTLCVEFQFYLFLGLLFPIFLRAPLSSLASLLLFSLLPSAEDLGYDTQGAGFIIFPYLPTFAVGIVGFLFREARVSKREAIIFLVIAAAFVVWRRSVPEMIIALAALGFILNVTKVAGWLTFFGTISYSLYLVHFTVYSRLFSFLGPLHKQLDYRMRARAAFGCYRSIFPLGGCRTSVTSDSQTISCLNPFRSIPWPIR